MSGRAPAGSTLITYLTCVRGETVTYVTCIIGPTSASATSRAGPG